MAEGIPSGYTQFLERLISDLPELAKRQPDVQSRLTQARLLSSGHEVGILHPLISKLHWAFRQNRLTKNRESKTFNVEFTPRRSTELTHCSLETAWRESSLQGEVGFAGREVFFQMVWGQGNSSGRLVNDDELTRTMRYWAVNAMALAIRLVERSGPTPRTS